MRISQVTGRGWEAGWIVAGMRKGPRAEKKQERMEGKQLEGLDPDMVLEGLTTALFYVFYVQTRADNIYYSHNQCLWS